MPRTRHTYRGLLREGWETESERWVAWAREPGVDSYWRFHRERFFELLPRPGRRALDLGCGEGRVARDLASLGHRLVGVDRSPAMLRAAAGAGSPAAALADAAQLPFAGAGFDLVVAFMSLQDMDDMPGAVAEAARVLERGGRLCLAVVHPLNAIGEFTSTADDAPFLVRGDYFRRDLYADVAERQGVSVSMPSRHWTLGDYFDAVHGAGLLTEAVREVGDTEGRWARLPLFLHIRALKP